MYTLMLSGPERKAIDWIGHRYAHGDRLRSLLLDCEYAPDADWDSGADLTFAVPEHVAWQISDIIDRDQLACFAASLKERLWRFQYSIV